VHEANLLELVNRHPILAHRDWLASFRITDDGAVALVFLPRPIVDPHHACPSLRRRYGVFGRDGGGLSLLTRIIGLGKTRRWAPVEADPR
jgi:hypothetical protein